MSETSKILFTKKLYVGWNLNVPKNTISLPNDRLFLFSYTIETRYFGNWVFFFFQLVFKSFIDVFTFRCIQPLRLSSYIFFLQLPDFCLSVFSLYSRCFFLYYSSIILGMCPAHSSFCFVICCVISSVPILLFPLWYQ